MGTNHLSQTIEPRVLTLEQAALYCGLSTSGFRDWIARGRIPGPLPGTRRWDRKAIDKALDVISKIEQPNPNSSAYDQWKASSTHESSTETRHIR